MRPSRFPAGLLFLAWLWCAGAAAAGEAREYWWYWDRPADQLPIPAPGVGAAVVVEHVLLSGEGASVTHRRSSLRLPDGVAIMPVVHVEIDPGHPFAGSPAQRDALRDVVAGVARRAPVAWVQLDFEARASQRGFWLAAVAAAKAALPDGVRLSVTALASWCYGDRWLGDATADEIVPMYFRLGRSRSDFLRRSATGPTEPRCALAYGVADDEPPWPVALPGRRYVFLGRKPFDQSQRKLMP